MFPYIAVREMTLLRKDALTRTRPGRRGRVFLSIFTVYQEDLSCSVLDPIVGMSFC